jgi:hypothetical protein
MQSEPKYNVVSVEALFGWFKGVERLIGLVQCRGLADYLSVQCEGLKKCLVQGRLQELFTKVFKKIDPLPLIPPPI